MEPTAVTWAVLGLLGMKPMSGYDIKRAVDRTIRHFWAASYGQIYPELRRLEEAGLIEGEDDPTGGRKRRAYSLTAAGDAALDEWLRSDAEPIYEVRDEAMLKLFFSDDLTKAERLRIVRQMRNRHQAVVDRLRSTEEVAQGAPLTTLQYGLGLHSWILDWCRKQEAELE